MLDPIAYESMAYSVKGSVSGRLLCAVSRIERSQCYLVSSLH